jgi:hypothetical protein
VRLPGCETESAYFKYIKPIMNNAIKTVDDYIAGFPTAVQEKLQLVRLTSISPATCAIQAALASYKALSSANSCR